MINIKKKSKISKARLGTIRTAHGELETPFFMPDATRAVLKGLCSEDIDRLDLPAMVVNTFHLYLQPGSNLIRKAGGVHAFMNYDRPLVSDSGGFQVFSLLHRGKDMGSLNDQGARFKSPIDGSWHELTPEKSIKVQLDLGTDIVICLDDCPPNDADQKTMDKALDRTIRWAGECKAVFDKEIKRRKIAKNKKPLLTAVIQGGESVDLRRYCAEALRQIGFDAYGYGARPVDKDGNFLSEVMVASAEASPEDSIRFALGVGTPEHIVLSARMGYDMFDCVIPTREGRHGKLFFHKKGRLCTQTGKLADFYKTINIGNAAFRTTKEAINPDSALSLLRNYSKSYLYHLFKVKDPLGARLASLNNLEFYTGLMRRIRESILEDKL
jgi:queuine tRNA-ribosyltransferase